MFRPRSGWLLVCLICFISKFECRHQVKKQSTKPTTTISPYLPVTKNPVSENLRHLEKFLKNVTHAAVKKMLPRMYELLQKVNVSSSCVISLMKYAISLKRIKVWAMRMFDASAKLPSGILDGTITEFGAFDQCLKILVKNRKGGEDFRGQYCSAEAKPNAGPKPANFSYAVKPNVKFNDSIMEEMRATIFAFYQLTLRFGICVPSTCTQTDMQAMGTEVVKPLKYKFRITSCHVSKEIEVEKLHVAILAIVSVLILLLAVGSVLDTRRNTEAETKKEKGDKTNLLRAVLLSFSVPANFKKLTSMNSSTGEMKSLHGIRALSMTWVILGHTYIWINFQTLTKSSKASDWFNNVEFEVILNGWLTVSSFFFLSGLLTTYTTINHMKNSKGRINVFAYIVKRFFRLFPSMVLILGSIFFLPWIASGPFWLELPGTEVKNCKQYWWTNLLFINNFRPIKEMCMQHSWYVSADLQLHIIALLILIPLYKNKFLGFSIIFLLSAIGTLAVGVITYVNAYTPTILLSTGNVVQIYNVIEDIHIKPFTYFAPYCVGIVIGFFLTKTRGIKIEKTVLIVGWSAASAISISSLYGIHNWNIGQSHGPLVTAIYAALHRTTFVIGLSWVTFVCATGNSPMVSTILSCWPLTLISRLAFMAYLVQGPVIWTRYGSVKERFFYSHFNLLYEYLGNLFLSLAIALAAHLLVEAPFANLERLLLMKSVTEITSVTSSNDHLTQVKTSSEDPKSKIVEHENGS